MPGEIRHEYREELVRLEEGALGAFDLVAVALDRTLLAVEHRDSELARQVANDDDRLDGRYLEIHQGLIALLATQSPVATDLRLIAALLHVIKNVERMGDQCVNICKVIPLAGHDAPQRDDMVEKVVRMGKQARSMVSQAKNARRRPLGSRGRLAIANSSRMPAAIQAEQPS